MWCPVNRAVACACLVISGVLAGGCVTTVPLKPTTEGLPPSARLPLTMGLYFDAGFQAYEHEDRYQGLVMPIGRASVTLFREVFETLFEHAAPVATRPPLAAPAPAVAAVIEPAVEAFDLGSGASESSEVSWAEIAYRLTLWSVQGNAIASWRVTGVGTAAADASLGRRGAQGQAVDLAITNAGARLLDVFSSVPEVREWLRGMGVGPVARKPVRLGHAP